MNQQIQTNALVSEPVTLINAFRMPPDEAERFLRAWKNNARVAAEQPGFIRARLHHCLDDNAEVRFINVVEFASGEALDKATAHPDFVASVRRLLDDPNLHVTAQPAVFRVAVDLHPGNEL